MTKYQIVSLQKEKILKAAELLEEFVMSELAAKLNCSPSSLSPYIHQLLKENKIKNIGHVYQKDEKGKLQWKNVYVYVT